MKALYETQAVIHQEMQEMVVTEGEATGPMPSKEITCQTHIQPKQQLCSWRRGAGV